MQLMIGVFKSRISLGKTLVASANVFLVSISLLFSLNTAKKISIVINGGHVASTLINNPTAKYFSTKSDYLENSQAHKVHVPITVSKNILNNQAISKAVVRPILKNSKNSQINKTITKKLAVKSLPGNLKKNIIHEGISLTKHQMNDLPPDPKGRIDGAEKLFVMSFTFNGNKIEKITWANQVVPVVKSESISVAQSSGPIGPVENKKTEVADVSDSVKISQSASTAAVISDDQILSIQEEIRGTIGEQDKSLSNFYQIEDVASDGQRVESISTEENENNENSEIVDPFSTQPISKTIGNAIERETERMGGGTRLADSGFVRSNVKAKVGIQKNISSKELITQPVNSQSKRAMKSPVENGQKSNLNTRSPGIVEDDNSNGLLEDVKNVQREADNISRLNLFGLEITRAGIIRTPIKENSLSFVSDLASDSIQYVSDRALVDNIQKGSTFDLRVIDDRYADSSQEISIDGLEIEKAVYFLKNELKEEIFEKLQVDSGLGHLLIKNDQVSLVEIDAKDDTTSVIYLDSSLNETSEEFFEYVFVTTRPGNIVANVTYKTGENRKKIFHLYGGEVRIDQVELIDRNEQGINLFTQRIMGAKTDYNGNASVFYDFQNSSQMNRRGPNHIEYVEPRALGGRGFIEVEEKNERYYIGTQFDTTAVVIPSVEFRKEVLNVFSAETLGRSCIVQVNLGQRVEDVEIISETGSGPISFEAMYLDKDGTFGDTATTETSTMFIKGEDVGVFEIYLQTSYGHRILRTYCSQSSYLVEQL